eukprot:8707-Heterococcus_DN1.PRE.3
MTAANTTSTGPTVKHLCEACTTRHDPHQTTVRLSMRMTQDRMFGSTVTAATLLRQVRQPNVDLCSYPKTKVAAVLIRDPVAARQRDAAIAGVIDRGSHKWCYTCCPPMMCGEVHGALSLIAVCGPLAVGDDCPC